jgi:exopolysaccharide/PEP-CTERM locus tyrosine autokinase
MSSLIEQAALRLEQLRQAGVAIPSAKAGVMNGVPRETGAATAGMPSQSVHDAIIVSRKVELDLPGLAAAGIVTPNAPRSHTADQFRVIKRPLISNAIGNNGSTVAHSNLIMVTSALVGEGKTYTSINLAMSLAAEVDHTVMLVDADVARPSVPRVLGLPEGPGLLDLLDGSSDMSSALLKTNIDKLTILPSGTPHPRATEMLASDAMRQLLADMAKRYPDRIIIFDSPPLLLTTEARALATNMGQIVLVVQAGKTLQSQVEHALTTIESCPVRMLVLNQARADVQGAYGYGYGYGYGQGYGRAQHQT